MSEPAYCTHGVDVTVWCPTCAIDTPTPQLTELEAAHLALDSAGAPRTEVCDTRTVRALTLAERVLRLAAAATRAAANLELLRVSHRQTVIEAADMRKALAGRIEP